MSISMTSLNVHHLPIWKEESLLFHNLCSKVARNSWIVFQVSCKQVIELHQVSIVDNIFHKDSITVIGSEPYSGLTYIGHDSQIWQFCINWSTARVYYWFGQLGVRHTTDQPEVDESQVLSEIEDKFAKNGFQQHLSKKNKEYQQK